jgi:hypothetical protein
MVCTFVSLARSPALRAAACLCRCRKAATISEYAIAASLVAAAALSAQSPRLHQVKDPPCAADRSGCVSPGHDLGGDTAAARAMTFKRPLNSFDQRRRPRD